MIYRITASGNEWQQVVQRVATNGNEWQWVTAIDNKKWRVIQWMTRVTTRERLQQIASNNSSDIDFENFMNFQIDILKDFVIR